MKSRPFGTVSEVIPETVLVRYGAWTMTPPSAKLIRNNVTTLFIAALGGLAASYLRTPLPWIFGSLLAVAFASTTLSQLSVHKNLSAGANVVWGLLIGSYVTSSFFSQLAAWWISLVVLCTYVFVGSYCAFLIGRRSYSAPTAYFMAMPGGLNEMFNIGTSFGADGRVIVITQTLRAFFIVALLPWFLHFRLSEAPIVSVDTPAGTAAGYFFLALALCVVPFSVKMKWPAPWMTGAAFGSAIVHMLGLTDVKVPYEILVSAQIIIGAGIGLGFKGFSWTEVKKASGIALTMTLLFFSLGAVLAYTLSLCLQASFYELLTCYTPGGIATMSIVAATYGFNVPFIAIHHVVRLFGILCCGPWIYAKWLKPSPTDE